MSLIISGGLFLKTIQELTLPTLAGNTGKYLRVASGEATLEWATVGGGTASAITVASEAVDQTCFPLFTTAATGDLSVYSNPELTFNSSLAVLGSRVLQSTATTGTPPMLIASTTKVVNLNADLLDGFDSTDFLGVKTATHSVAGSSYTRIAESPIDIGLCAGTFKIKHTSSLGYGELIFHASIQSSLGAVSSSAVSISQFGGFSTLGLIIRIVYHTTATGNYAYLEIYNSPPANMILVIEMIDGTGWTLNSSYTAGSVPAGYTSQSITAGRGLVSIFDITANNQLKSTVATGTAPLAVTSTTVVTNLNADKVDGYDASSFLLTGGQIPFPASQNASSDANTLDDYEEGTFTPRIEGTTTAGTGTYTTQLGKYIKIGGLVRIGIDMAWTAHTGTGNIVIKGLPFSAAGYGNAVSIRCSNMTLGTGYYGVQGFAWGTTIDVERWNGTTQGGLPMDTSAGFIISGVYSVV